MPNTNYLKFRIGNREIEVSDISSVPVSIDYQLEDSEDFEKKRSSMAFDIVLPATQNNSQTFNSPSNPDVEDLTADEFFSSHQPCVIEANGVEILKGRAFLIEATHTDRPEKIKVNCYGNNADWLIDLKEATLMDFVNPNDHAFNGQTIETSWNYDGYSETNDFVYAPVRYIKPFLDGDKTATPYEMKPAISIYWLLYRALKSQGYKIESTFLDSAYFRRLVMPWTWGDFLFTDEDVQKPYKFRRMCTQQEKVTGRTGAWNESVSPISGAPVNQTIQWDDIKSLSTGTLEGGFEGTNGISSWNSLVGLSYKYPANSVLGFVTAGFQLNLYYYVYAPSGNQSWGLYADWFINGIAHSSNLLYQYSGSGAKSGNASLSKELQLTPNDTVHCRLRISAGQPLSTWQWEVGNTEMTAKLNNQPVSSFELTHFKKTIGSPVRFKNFPALKKHKWLDLLRGVIDAFNLSMQTDPVTKTLYLEPTYDYHTGSSPLPKKQGYFGKGTLDWRQKQDLSKESTMQLYGDNEREFNFKFKDDSNDGGKNILAKRSTVEVGSSRYLFPDRFKTGKKEFANRFFTPVVHVEFSGFEGATGRKPQLIALIPENVSNTSKETDATNFEPKLAYYKGKVSDVGGWYWQPNPNDGSTRQALTTLPFMFAVNYQTGGEADPVLTYCDQRIGTNLGQGLMRRFFLQRLAIMRHGRLYSTYINLDTNDITNWLHREWVVIGGKKYALIGIEKFQPLRDETTKCMLWQWEPVSIKDDAAVFPSNASVMGTSSTLSSSDLGYAQSLILPADLPK